MDSIDDLEKALADLAAARRRLDDYDGNNPNKHRTAVAEARERAYRVERSLKRARLIALTHRMTRLNSNWMRSTRTPGARPQLNTWGSGTSRLLPLVPTPCPVA